MPGELYFALQTRKKKNRVREYMCVCSVGFIGTLFAFFLRFLIFIYLFLFFCNFGPLHPGQETDKSARQVVYMVKAPINAINTIMELYAGWATMKYVMNQQKGSQLLEYDMHQIATQLAFFSSVSFLCFCVFCTKMHGDDCFTIVSWATNEQANQQTI